LEDDVEKLLKQLEINRLIGDTGTIENTFPQICTAGEVCRRAGVDEHSRAGIALRWQLAHGDEPMSPELAQAIDELEDIERAERDAEFAKACAEHEYRHAIDGYVDVGTDEYSAQFWGRAERAGLELIGDFRGQFHRTVYRLPNGDLMVVIDGKSWTRYTADMALAADRTWRRAIKRYRYEPTLYSALAELERAGALRLTVCTWFGGSLWPNDCTMGAYSGPRNMTGPEKVRRLREYLAECIEAHPEHRVALDAALALAVDGSIMHETGDKPAATEAA
jgi:hypothetical protein